MSKIFDLHGWGYKDLKSVHVCFGLREEIPSLMDLHESYQEENTRRIAAS